MAMTILGTDLMRETCCSCGTQFAMSGDVYRRCINDHTKSFFCPNGHGQQYTGPSEEFKLREQLAAAERTSKQYEQCYRDATKSRDNATKALRSATTRMRNLKTRVANGVCPCCKRQFANLHRHMTHMHKAYKP